MNVRPPSKPSSILSRTSLRAKIAFFVGVPILVALISYSVAHYFRQRSLLEEQLQLTAQRVGEMTLGSLDHVMMINDTEMLSQILVDLGEMPSVQQVRIVDLLGRVSAASDPSLVGRINKQDEAGCTECHQYSPQTRPRTTHLTAAGDILRISTPIENQPACTSCHSSSISHLGVLLIDMSLVDIHEQLSSTLRADLALSAGSSLLVAFAAFLLIHVLVVRRVETFRDPLARLAAGDFSARLPKPKPPTDELGELAETFNLMAADLEHHIREEKERSMVRQQAIIQERERIARELHDGLSQLLGYVNAKASAVRLLLRDGKDVSAEHQLQQLEEAARELSIDVREAILGLKLAGQVGAGLCSNLKQLTEQVGRMGRQTISLEIDSDFQEVTLPPETELELLRICQEALTNARKHTSTEEVHVRLGFDDQALMLTICDEGPGFDYANAASGEEPHFGLSSMRERAREIGADLVIDSRPGEGTVVRVRLPLEEE